MAPRGAGRPSHDLIKRCATSAIHAPRVSLSGAPGAVFVAGSRKTSEPAAQSRALLIRGCLAANGEWVFAATPSCFPVRARRWTGSRFAAPILPLPRKELVSEEAHVSEALLATAVVRSEALLAAAVVRSLQMQIGAGPQRRGAR